MKKYFHITWVIFNLIMPFNGYISISAQSSPSACNRLSDSLELVKLYENFQGDNWKDNTNWLEPGESIDTWYGVEINAQGCVTSINLDENDLYGDLIDFKFEGLQTLSLAKNDITGSLIDFSQMPVLETLNLSDNFIFGNIPNFQNLNNLDYLDLSTNDLEGVIPDFTKLPNLTTLSIFDNFLSGSLPNFTNLKKLGTMWLDGNELSGTIPDFNNMPELGSLYLGRNKFKGSLPVFSKIPNLWFLSLGENEFTGKIPNYTNLPKLWLLDLSSCLLTGEIPSFNLPNLRDLFLRDNYLTGNIPDFSNTKNLSFLELGSNKLSGNIPDFSNLPSLNSVWLYDNCFSGPIPNTPFITWFHYYDNKFTFSDILASGKKSPTYYYAPQQEFYNDTVVLIPKDKSFTINLGIDKAIKDNVYKVYLINNGVLNFQFSQDTNNILFSNPQAGSSGRYIVQVTNPRLPNLTLKSKTISLRVCDPQKDSTELVRLFNATGGVNWTNKNNWLINNRPISSWYGIQTNTLGCVQKIELGNNNLQGNIPLLNMSNLDTLIFENNALNGKIPEVKIPFVKMLNLSQNQLSGEIPNAISEWNNIQNLNLGKNSLSGGVPPDLGDLCDLRSLKMNNNNFKGQLPDKLTMLPNLQKGQVDFGNNQIDSLNDKFIWFCPFGDSIFRANPSFNRFLGICNIKCSGKEFESLNDFPWIKDTINKLNCKVSGCELTDVHAGFVEVREVRVFYTFSRCYAVKGPPSEYNDVVKFYDCGGHLLETVTNTEKNNFASTYHAITLEDFEKLVYDVKWQCGQKLGNTTDVRYPPVKRKPKNKQNAFSIICSPNPAKGKVICDFEIINNTIPLVNLINSYGQNYNVPSRVNHSKLELNLENVSPGLYVIMVQANHKLYTGKIIVQE